MNIDRISVPAVNPQKPHTLRERFRRVFQLLLHFFVGQGALLAVNFAAELFLVRKLSVDSYAQFGVAYGFQATVRILMDLGFASTIIPLVGERHEDRALVGKYVRSAKHLRDRSFYLLAPFASLAFLAIVHKHHWSYTSQFLLLASVLLALYSSGGASYYAAPLLLYGRLKDYYLPQTAAGLARIIAYVCLRLMGLLNASAAAGLSALSIFAGATLLERKGRQCIEWPEQEDRAADRKVIEYILPATPAIIFSAFQTQISLFLISIFGQTANIAEVAALGRIGQLFAVLMTFNTVIVEPYIARLSRAQLLTAYLRLLAIASAGCVLLVLVAFRFPTIFVWILGAKYSGLRSLIGWVILAGSINYVAGLIWIMNRARKWLFWSGTWLEVVLLLAMQIWFLAYVGVRTTWHAVLFTFVSSFCYLIAHGYVAVYGFLNGPRVELERALSLKAGPDL